jgi:GAF domain-containing protein
MEKLIITSADKAGIYQEILPQIEGVISFETDLIANTANVAAILKEAFDFFWVGFYFVKGEQLVLGPFQGPLACTRIQYGKGVCGSAWKQKQTLVVPDVDKFPGHIACSSLSRSEIVVPILKNGEVVAVLDIDSKDLSTFDHTDAQHLETLALMLEKLF